MSPDYDAADDGSSVLTEQQIFSNKGTVDDAMWKNQNLDLKPENLNRLYKSHVVMSDGRFGLTAQDEKTIDPAQVFICTDCPTASNNGKLFVEYVVELMIPQTNTETPGIGGFMQLPVASTITPIQGVPLVNRQSVKEPILKVSSVFPTSIVGQFTKDFEGVFTTNMGGTGITTAPSVKVSKDSSPSYAAEGNVFNSVQTIINGTASNVFSQIPIKALAGEFLKLNVGDATTLSNVNSWLASAAYNTLI